MKKGKSPIGLVDGHRSLVAKAKRFTSRGRSKWKKSGPEIPYATTHLPFGAHLPTKFSGGPLAKESHSLFSKNNLLTTFHATTSAIDRTLSPTERAREATLPLPFKTSRSSAADPTFDSK